MRTLVADVLGCYVARSPKQLLSLYDASMHPTLRFIDPFAVAAPLPEARLQFYALQKYVVLGGVQQERPYFDGTTGYACLIL
jgi:hypothetical protein